MDLWYIRQTIERALELRGTVMLVVGEDERRWCAACAAVDGSLELRVGEPGSTWRRRERRAGEEWLRDHGFVRVIDAWAKPVARGTSLWTCAQLLADALIHALHVRDGSSVVERLVHPGVMSAAQPPAPDAPHADHIRSALVALARQGRGKLDIQCGRPAVTWAWAFVIEGRLVLSPERGDEWTVDLDEETVASAADRLTTMLHEQFEPDAQDPLFISYMETEPA
jgi:hypothetical protein